MDKQLIIKKALKYLAMLKRNKQIKNSNELADLKLTMKLLERLMYEKKWGIQETDIRPKTKKTINRLFS